MRDNRLHSILELTNAINANLPEEQLYRIFTFILKEQLYFNRFALLLQRQDWELATKSGVKNKWSAEALAADLQRFKDITMVVSSNSPALQDFQAVIPIQHHGQPLAYLLIATTRETETLTTAHFSFAQTLANILCVALGAKQYR